MILEALTPFDLKVSGEVRTFKSGDRFDLPEEKAERLRRLAGAKIRVIVEGTNIQESESVRAVSSTQAAFDLNSGHNPTAPIIRKTTYSEGTIVTIQSPMFGRYEAEVLRDNGVVIWVLHPFIQREVAIPSEWLIDGERQAV